MTKKVNKKILYITLIFVCLVLVSTFVIEYGLNHQPCNLCVYERIPYFISILLISKILFTQDYEKITLSILSLVFIISSALAFYHFGIEQGFFEETLVCTASNLSEALTKEEVLDQLNQNIISCKNVSFRIFGFSLATINTIFSIILSAIFIRLFINYEKN
tara:strand:+ start:245 stop:727 length:483 start_codon:yes stop_codon:yes gene_type:complete